jgi:Tfp pilus assembly protein FimT
MAEKGYTLLELVLVCLITALVSTLGIGAWGRAAEQVRLHSACRVFASALTRARSQAIAKNVSLRLHINPDGRRFALSPTTAQPASWQPLPSGVSFTGATQGAPVFYSRGSVVPAGTFVLSNQCGSIRVILSPGGRIRWQRDP